MRKFASVALKVLVFLALLAPLLTSRNYLFPYITTKAFYFRILIELALPFYLYLIIADPRLRPKWRNPLNLAVLAFLAVNILSAFAGVNPYRSFWGNFERMGGVYYIAHLTLLYFYVLMFGQMGGKALKYYLMSFVGVCAAITINGIFGKLGGPTIVQDPSLPYRVSSTLGNPIYLGSLLIIPLFFTLFFAVQEESRGKKIWYYILSFLQVVGIFLSGTRGAVVGLAVGGFISALVYLFITKSQATKRAGFIALAAFVLLVGGLFAVHDKLKLGTDLNRLFTLNDSNTQARLIQWKSAIAGFNEHPVLGTGAENYYVIANKYYDSELFKYDRSWFDKPHNYLLEILVTNGIVGFISYLAILGFAGWALIKAYRAGYYGELALCLLLASLLVYQLQNMFVFDSIPSSMAFYSFLGFAAYLWWESESQGDKRSKKQQFPDQAFPVAVFGLALVGAIYMVVVTNVTPATASKNINFGYAYGSVDTAKAYEFFEKAKSASFNFDKGELATKYTEFGERAVQRATAKDRDMAVKSLNSGIETLEQVTEQNPDYAPYWFALSGAYLNRGIMLERKIDSKAFTALEKNMELAPNRIEGRLFMARIRMTQNNIPEAERLLNELKTQFPTSNEVKALQAQVYRSQGRLDEAVKEMEQLIGSGYKWNSLSEIQWLADYHKQQNNLSRAVFLLEETTKIDPNNVEAYVQLVRLYAQTGEKNKAYNLAQAISKADANRKPEMDALIRSLK